MLCQKCKKNNATTDVLISVNGVKEKYCLCDSCAAEYSVNSFSNMNFGGFLDPFLNLIYPKTYTGSKDSLVCDFCHTGLNEILKTGKLGCSHCYDVFSDAIMPTVKNIHGRTMHVGKRSKIENTVSEDKVSKLQKQLELAVSEQNFELAAKLRDEINELKGSDRNVQSE